MPITGPLCRAGRALAQLSREDLAEAAGVSKKIIREFESADVEPDAQARLALKQALETKGVVFLAEGDMGAGVRLRFTAKDVKQMRRLEGEGGPVGEDDV